MEILGFDLHSQRNAAHYQFQTDFNVMVIKYTPQSLGIVEAYAAYLPHYNDEGVALVAITKSATTEQIENADKDRDFTFSGLVAQVRSCLKHFNSDVREAAKRVLVIFDEFGNLVPMPLDQESGAIKALIAQLRTNFSADLTTLEIVGWIAELERQNNVFVTLEDARNSEEASRTELRMKEVRVKVDAAYTTIVKRINALIIVNGETAFTEFVKELNIRIVRAKDSVAQIRADRRKSNEPAA